MTQYSFGHCLTCLIAFRALETRAQSAPHEDFDYDFPIEKLPKLSGALGSATIFKSEDGAARLFHEQVLAFQGFDGDERTTKGLAGNGNSNTRVGVTFTQSLDDVTLRPRSDTGLGMCNSASTAITIGRTNDGFDGARRCRGHHDTPAFSDVMVSTSDGRDAPPSGANNDHHDATIRLTDDIGDSAARSAAGHRWINDPYRDIRETEAGSATRCHTPTGLDLAVSAGEEIDGTDYVWARAGGRSDFFTIGTVSLSLDCYCFCDFVSDSERTRYFGSPAVQSIDPASVDPCAGWRRFAYSDRPDGGDQDADGLLIGAPASFLSMEGWPRSVPAWREPGSGVGQIRPWSTSGGSAGNARTISGPKAVPSRSGLGSVTAWGTA